MIAALYCPACKLTFPNLNHWSEGPCSANAQSRGWWHSLIQGQLADKRHRDLNITVTRLLGCPKEWIIQDTRPTTFHPFHAHTPAVGTLVQAAIARHVPQGWVAEREVSGVILGLPCSASIDLSKDEYIGARAVDGGMRYEDHHGYICEGKFHSTSKDGYKEWTLKDDHAAQVNMQRILWEQSEPGLKVVEMKVVRSSMAKGGELMPTFDVPVWNEERIAAYRPGGGDFTVGHIVGMIMGFKESGEMPPLVGESMFNRKKCSAYCSVKRECDELG